jgi:hypothetical protein
MLITMIWQPGLYFESSALQVYEFKVGIKAEAFILLII